MSSQNIRLFINNINEQIDENCLQEKLSQFGTISSIEIKQRKNIIGNQTAAFAYINIDLTQENLQKCFKDFSTQKFKNIFIDISVAKESFLERLKRERDVSNESSSNLLPKIISQGKNVGSNKTNNLNLNLDYLDPKNKALKNEGNNRLDNYKSNKNNYEVIEKNHDTVKANVNPIQISESEQKRLQSISNKKKEYQSKKNLVQKALSHVDIKPNKKIVFDEDKYFENCHLEKNNLQKTNGHNSLQLFADESDEDENDINFEIKEQFQGVKGQKLLKLQSKFKNDKRFTMDSRFLEDEDDGFSEKKAEDDVDEKQKELLILEEVLGKRIISPKKLDSRTPEKPVVGMLRYDPDAKDHMKYEIKRIEKELESKKRTLDESDNENEQEKCKNENPEVSKTKFYKVTENLKSVFENNEQFSLLGTFGTNYENEVQENQNLTHLHSESKLKLHKDIDKNPFKYDSSDSEENDETSKLPSQDSKATQINRTFKFQNENFFFKNDDYRLQQGLDFIKKIEAEEEQDFRKLRRSIKEVIKAKMRNNQRKNKMFKKKLGGKKRIKMKRAMKR